MDDTPNTAKIEQTEIQPLKTQEYKDFLSQPSEGAAKWARHSVTVNAQQLLQCLTLSLLPFLLQGHNHNSSDAWAYTSYNTLAIV